MFGHPKEDSVAGVSKPGIVSTLDEVDDSETVVMDGSDEYIDHEVKGGGGH